MCIWMSPYYSTAALVGQAFGSYLEFWLSPRPRAKPQCIAILEDADPFNMTPTSISSNISCFTIIICCGCAHGWVLTPLLPLFLTRCKTLTKTIHCSYNSKIQAPRNNKFVLFLFLNFMDKSIIWCSLVVLNACNLYFRRVSIQVHSTYSFNL